MLYHQNKMAKYRVAIEHINTHEVSTWEVEAEAMSMAAGRGLQENDRNTSDEIHLFEVVGVWRLDVPLQGETKNGA